MKFIRNYNLLLYFLNENKKFQKIHFVFRKQKIKSSTKYICFFLFLINKNLKTEFRKRKNKKKNWNGYQMRLYQLGRFPCILESCFLLAGLMGLFRSLGKELEVAMFLAASAFLFPRFVSIFSTLSLLFMIKI